MRVKLPLLLQLFLESTDNRQQLLILPFENHHRIRGHPHAHIRVSKLRKLAISILELPLQELYSRSRGLPESCFGAKLVVGGFQALDNLQEICVLLLDAYELMAETGGVPIRCS